MTELLVSLPPDALEQLVARVADVLAERGLPTADVDPDPWLDVAAAAAYIAAKPKRIYDLRSQGRLRYAKDGSRLLFRRSWLDECLEQPPT